MGFVAFLIIAAGAYLVDAAVQNRKPLETLRQIIADPSKAQATLAATKGTGFASASYVPSSATTGSANTPDASGSGPGAAAVAFARSQIGKPYRWGATGPDRYDCSGLVQASYAHAGLKLPRTSYQMLSYGTKVGKDALQVGDLVWPDLGHVQLYSGGGMVVEAPHTGAFVREVKMYGFFTARRPIGGASARTGAKGGVGASGRT